MPLGWVAAAGAVAGLAGSAMQAGAATDAANTQAQSAANAQGISQQQYQDTVNRNAPFTQSGYGALSALDYGLGITPQTASGGVPGSQGGNGYDPSSGYRIGAGGGISQMIPGGTSGPIGGSGLPTTQPGAQPQTGGLGFGSLTKSFDTSDWQKLSPAYNFQLRQGQQGVLNADASGQGALSGAAMKDLTNYNQSEANTSFNSALNQYQTQQGNIFSRLSGIAGLGQSSANNTGQQGTTLAGQAAQSATNIGTAQAGGIVGSANAIAGGLSSAAPWLAYGGGGNSNPAAWDTENPNNFQDFQSSDRRLKTDIRQVGTYPSGLPVYEYRFKYNLQDLHTGVMADEVELMYPSAVRVGLSGFKMVNYGMLR